MLQGFGWATDRLDCGLPAADNIVLGHFAIQRHARPVELLGRFALVPARHQEGRQHLLTLGLGLVCACLVLLAEPFRQV